VAIVLGGRIRLLSRHIDVRSGCCSQVQAPKKNAVKCENECLGARRGTQISFKFHSCLSDVVVYKHKCLHILLSDLCIEGVRSLCGTCRGGKFIALDFLRWKVRGEGAVIGDREEIWERRESGV